MLTYPDAPQNVIHTSKYLFRNERQNFSPILGENTRKYIAIHTASRATDNSVSLQFLSLTAIHISQAHAHIPTASATVMSIIKQKNIKSNIFVNLLFLKFLYLLSFPLPPHLFPILNGEDALFVSSSSVTQDIYCSKRYSAIGHRKILCGLYSERFPAHVVIEQLILVAGYD